MTVAELARRHGHVPAGDLEEWLLDSGLATNGDGLLRPTRLAVQIADALEV